MLIYNAFLQDVPLYKDDYRVYEILEGILLTSKEAFVASFLLEKFVPTMKRTFLNANPVEFAKWQGNCCRQVALMVSLALQEAMPDYQWTPYEGDFTDPHGSYEHAFVIGERNGKMLLVDLSRQMYPSLFMPVSKIEYPTFGLYGQMKMTGYRKMPVELYLMNNEYYTQIRGFELFELIKDRCRSDAIDLEKRMQHGLFPFIKRTITMKEACVNV